MTLTKSWLQKQITDLEATHDEIPFGLGEDGNNTLAALKLALAGMEAEPVINRQSICNKVHDKCSRLPGATFYNAAEFALDEIYAAPQPATVVQDENYQHLSELYHSQEKRLFKLAQRLKGPSFDKYAHSPSQAIDVLEAAIFGVDEEDCRAAVPQGKAEQAGKMPDDFDFDRFNDVVWLEAVASNPHMHSLTTSTIAMVALELNRRLDADGKPELTVWYGPMPESNGKTNWTAILHRKGEDMLDGITIDRSEYPGRVLYAADRARYLIGEKPDRPFILDYDADKHSGYVAPGKADGNYPVIPDDVRRMDWLVSKTVDVREPLVYGSHSLFWSQTLTDEEDDHHATKLREQIDAAMAAEKAAAPQQEVKP